MTTTTTTARLATTATTRLLEATEKLLADKGIRATTMQEVAEAAGVSRAWLYRHFPDKPSLIGAAIVRLNQTLWDDARTKLDEFDSLDHQLAAGVHIGRGAYDDPGALLLRLRVDEPEEYNTCAGVGVTGLVPDLAAFWRPYLELAVERGQIDPNHDLAEVSEWVARMLISLGTTPGDTIDLDDDDALAGQIRRYLLPALRTDPRKPHR